MDTDWELKLEAIKALVGWSSVSLKMHKPGDWYVSVTGLEIKEGGLLTSVKGNGHTPQAAVEDCWATMTNLPSDHRLVLDAYGQNRCEVRWNGYMWAPFKG